MGKKADEIVQNARMQIADSLGVEPRHIIFVNSGSEANNTALKGIAFRNLEPKGHIITSRIEHASVLRPVEYLEQLGCAVTYLDVGKDGLVTPEIVSRSLRRDTILPLSLNRIGVYVSAGSACSSWEQQGSHVVKALGIDENKFGVIRFSYAGEGL